MNGWVKLHRQIIENDFLQNDTTAYILFTKLLLAANIDDGTYITGRYRLESLTGLKATTAYKALKRLENEGMVTQVSNNRFTTIRICNWDVYQGSGNSTSNNQVTTKGQQSNNKVTLYKNKERRNKNIIQNKNYVIDKPIDNKVDYRGEHSPAKEKLRKMFKSVDKSS